MRAIKNNDQKESLREEFRSILRAAFNTIQGDEPYSQTAIENNIIDKIEQKLAEAFEDGRKYQSLRVVLGLADFDATVVMNDEKLEGRDLEIISKKVNNLKQKYNLKGEENE